MVLLGTWTDPGKRIQLNRTFLFRAAGEGSSASTRVRFGAGVFSTVLLSGLGMNILHLVLMIVESGGMFSLLYSS